VGIVRKEDEMMRALTGLQKLWDRAPVGATGNREYNPGWHTALDLANLLTVPKLSPVRRWSARKPRAHFRDDYPNRDAALER